MSVRNGRRGWSYAIDPRAALAAVLWALAAPVAAGVCSVPGTHALIQDAVDDPACSIVELAAGTYAESIVIGRSVTVAGPAGGGAVLAGMVRAGRAGDAVTLRDLRVENGCAGRAVTVGAGAALVTDGVAVVRQEGLPCPDISLFSDGFESGDSGAWSSTVPLPSAVQGTSEASRAPSPSTR